MIKKTPLFIFYFKCIGLISLAVFNCNRSPDINYYDRLNSGSKLLPANFWRGQHLGYQVIMDRAGHIKKTAQLTQTCQATDDTHGVCEVKRVFYKKKSIESWKFDWKIRYDDHQNMEITIKNKYGSKLNGPARGSVMVLTGNQPIPGEKDKNATCELHLRALPDSTQSYYEITNYSFMGFTIGSTNTIWKKSGD